MCFPAFIRIIPLQWTDRCTRVDRLVHSSARICSLEWNDRDVLLKIYWLQYYNLWLSVGYNKNERLFGYSLLSVHAQTYRNTVFDEWEMPVMVWEMHCFKRVFLIKPWEMHVNNFILILYTFSNQINMRYYENMRNVFAFFILVEESSKARTKQDKRKAYCIQKSPLSWNNKREKLLWKLLLFYPYFLYKIYFIYIQFLRREDSTLFTLA